MNIREITDFLRILDYNFIEFDEFNAKACSIIYLAAEKSELVNKIN